MKKALSILLCVLMLTGIMAVAVSAENFNNVEVSVYKPIPGENPSFEAFIVFPEEGVEVQDYTSGDYINGVAWYDVSAGLFMNESDEFVEGQEYTCYVWVSPEDPSEDVFDNNFNAYIVDAENSDFDGNSSNEARVYGTFECTKPQIDRVNISPEADPKCCELAYNLELTTAGVVSIDRSYNSDGFVKGVKWLEDGSRVMKKGERFKPDTHYCVQLRLVIANGYEFALNTDVYVWINKEDGFVIGSVINGDTDYLVAELDMDYTEHPAKGLYTSSDGAKFYFTSEGKMYVKRLASVNGKKYYFGADGVAYTKRLISVDGKKYYMGADGVAYTSRLISVSGKKYYMGKDGIAYTKRLISVDGKKYYMGADGVAYTSKLISVDGKKYYMGKDGVAYKSKLISVSGKKYYIGKDCIAYKSKFASLSGKKYYFGSDCVMYKSKTFSVSGVKWKADSNGVCKKV